MPFDFPLHGVTSAQQCGDVLRPSSSELGTDKFRLIVRPSSAVCSRMYLTCNACDQKKKNTQQDAEARVHAIPLTNQQEATEKTDSSTFPKTRRSSPHSLLTFPEEYCKQHVPQFGDALLRNVLGFLKDLIRDARHTTVVDLPPNPVSTLMNVITTLCSHTMKRSFFCQLAPSAPGSEVRTPPPSQNTAQQPSEAWPRSCGMSLIH